MAAAATKIKAGREEAVTTVLVLIAGTMTEVVVVVVVATAVVEEAVALAVDEEQAHSTTHLAVDMIQVAIMTPTPLHLWVGTASMTVVYKGRARKIHTITRDHHRQLTTLDSSGMRRRRRLMLMTRTGSRRMAVDIKVRLSSHDCFVSDMPLFRSFVLQCGATGSVNVGCGLHCNLSVHFMSFGH